MIPTRRGSLEWMQCGIGEKRQRETMANTIGGPNTPQVTPVKNISNNALRQCYKLTEGTILVPHLEDRAAQWKLTGLEDPSNVTIVARLVTLQGTAGNPESSTKFER